MDMSRSCVSSRRRLWFAAAALVAAGGHALLAQAPSPPPAAAAMDKNVVAEVNGQLITRAELADELIARKGKKELQLLINRRIIEQACRQAGVTATDAEVEAELRKVVKEMAPPEVQDLIKWDAGKAGARFVRSIAREKTQ